MLGMDDVQTLHVGHYNVISEMTHTAGAVLSEQYRKHSMTNSSAVQQFSSMMH